MGTSFVSRSGRVFARVLPFALALFMGLWGMRGLESHAPVDSDATRHAMNGVFLHDALRDGGMAHLPAYAKAYYTQYPALSLPYHPPLFPLAEALFYLALGVGLLPARLAVALATAACVLLLYRLVGRTHSSAGLAAAATVLFFSLGSTLRLSADVMLELPTLALVLAALTWLPGTTWKVGQSLGFFLMAAAAVWTKQNAVFIGLVPFLWIAIERRWQDLRRPWLWIGAGVFGFSTVALAAISAKFGVAGNKGWPAFEPLSILRHNIPYYVQVVKDEVGLLPGLLVAATLVVISVRRRHQDTLYLAWAASVFLVAFLMPPYDYRYVFFGYPALAVLVCSVLSAEGRLWPVPIAAAVLWFATHINTAPPYVDGPAEAARVVAAAHIERVLYCGRSNGNFIFALRTLDPQRRTSVIRGDKLPKPVFDSASLTQFARDNGVQMVVLEESPIPRAWDGLAKTLPPSFTLLGDLPLRSSDEWMNGSLRIARLKTTPVVAGSLPASQ